MALDSIKSTGVKFYSSLTRNQAKGVDPISSSSYTKVLSTTVSVADVSIYYSDEECKTVDAAPSWNGSNTYYYKKYFVEPGAICYVSDDDGNSIFLNGLLFGDGAKAGSGGGSGGGLTEVTLSDVPVITVDGVVTKTLDDYYDDNGNFTPDKIIIYNNGSEAVVIDKNGISIGNDTVVTQTILDTAVNDLDGKITEAKNLISSVYKVKGSKDTFADLSSITDAKEGDVWNIKSESKDATGKKITPAGTNYVYIVPETGDPYWDALGGTFDMSLFYTATEVDSKITTAKTEANNYTDTKVSGMESQIETNTSAISGLGSQYTGLDSRVTNNTSNIASNLNKINTNITNISNLSTQLTWQ